MVVCFVRMGLEREWSTFPKGDILSVNIALLTFMYLHDVLCGSLGAIKLDIELWCYNFFKNIHPLLISKYLVYYLGLPLTAIPAYDKLNIV